MDSSGGGAAALALVRADRLAEAEAAALAATDRGIAVLVEGAIAARRGDLVRALSLTGQAVQLGIDDAESLTALATVQLALGHPSFAVIPAERAVRLAPDRSESHAVLAAAYQRLGHGDRALDSIRRAAVAAAVASGATYDTPAFRVVKAELAEQRAAAERAKAEKDDTARKAPAVVAAAQS
jgi:Flp pilus assembly protein TadD